MAWVTLTSIKRISEHGKTVIYHPGDSVKVGKQTALEWIMDGTAKDPFEQVGMPAEGALSPDYGIVILAKEGTVANGALNGLLSKVNVEYADAPVIPYKYTFLWDPTCPVRQQLVNYGWMRISKENPHDEQWEMAAFLVNLKLTAAQVGNEADKRETREAIGDLRLPVYDSRALWLRKTKQTINVVESYAEYLEAGVHKYHAFLRALYLRRAKLCTLPMDWIK